MGGREGKVSFIAPRSVPTTSDTLKGNLFQTVLNNGSHENYIRLLLEYGAYPEFTPNDHGLGGGLSRSPCGIAIYKAADELKTKDLQIVNLFAEAADMKMENKLKYFRLVLKGFLDEISFFEGFKKQLSTVSAAELGEATVRTQWAMDWTELN